MCWNNCIKDEYQKSNSTSFSSFIRKHKYLNNELIYSLDKEYLYNFIDADIQRYNDNDYKNNFINIISKIGKIPLYNEFVLHTKISDVSYSNKYNLKGKVYDSIVKMFVSKEQYNNYLIEKRMHKTNVGKQTANMNKFLLTLEELEIEFKKVFDETKFKYNVYPSRRYFDKVSKHDSSVYRQKLNMSWTDVCKLYGYDIQNKKSAEYIVLGKIKDILQSNYIPQKKWDWLIGIKNYPLRVDGYFEEYNLVVEFDGKQHKEPVDKYGGKDSFEVLKTNDEIKNILIPQHGIKLLRISAFDDWFNDDFLKQELSNIGIEIPINKRSISA